MCVWLSVLGPARCPHRRSADDLWLVSCPPVNRTMRRTAPVTLLHLPGSSLLIISLASFLLPCSHHILLIIRSSFLSFYFLFVFTILEDSGGFLRIFFENLEQIFRFLEDPPIKSSKKSEWILTVSIDSRLPENPKASWSILKYREASASHLRERNTDGGQAWEKRSNHQRNQSKIPPLLLVKGGGPPPHLPPSPPFHCLPPHRSIANCWLPATIKR